MNWEQRTERYLSFFGYELLGFECGLVFWKDTNGKVWGSAESALNLKMIEWEKPLKGTIE